MSTLLNSHCPKVYINLLIIYILTILYIILSLAIGIKIIDQFRDGFDLFSGGPIFEYFFGLLWPFVSHDFGLYYTIIQ